MGHTAAWRHGREAGLPRRQSPPRSAVLSHEPLPRMPLCPPASLTRARQPSQADERAAPRLDGLILKKYLLSQLVGEAL